MSFHYRWGQRTNAANVKIIIGRLGDLGWPDGKRLLSSAVPSRNAMERLPFGELIGRDVSMIRSSRPRGVGFVLAWMLAVLVAAAVPAPRPLPPARAPA